MCENNLFILVPLFSTSFDLLSPFGEFGRSLHISARRRTAFVLSYPRHFSKCQHVKIIQMPRIIQ